MEVHNTTKANSIPQGCGMTKNIQGGIPNENSTQHFSFKHTP